MPVHTSTSTPIATGVKVPSTPALNYVTLGSFSWDQDNDKVKNMYEEGDGEIK
uniref:Uncharacterized protein n=1 Tax=Manihot esculenta TaxID=3983 RepID=A0A2C9VIB5_MANES